MITRFKLIAAALGFVIATGAVADASAKTIVKTHVAARHVVTHHVATAPAFKSHKFVLRAHPRLHVGTRFVKHIKIVHRAPIMKKVVTAAVYKPVRIVARPLYRTHLGTRFVKHVKIVKHVAAKQLVAKRVFTKKIVRLNKAPLQQHAMNHRAVAKTVIR